MPASDSGGAKTPAEARALVESLALDGGALTDADLSTISLPHSADQFSTELDCFVNIQAELDRMVEVEESFVEEVEESFVEGLENCNLETETVEVTLNEDGCMEDIAATPETILPDMVEETIGMEGMEVSEMIAHSSTIEEIIEPEPETTLSQIQDTTESVVFTSLNNSNQSQVSAPSIVVIQSPATAANVNNPTHLTVSNGQIVPLSSATNNKTISSVAAQNIAGSLIMSKPNEQCRFFQIGQTNVPKPVTVTSNIQGIRPLQGTIKRPAASGSLPFFAKVIIAGNQQGQQGQPVVISQPNNEAFPSQQIKIIGPGSAVQHPNIIGSPPKTITLAQAQQLGLLTTSKLQQILPSSSAKSGIVVNKLMTGPVKVQPKFTVVPSSGIRSPAKILPAPAVSGISQIKSVVPTSGGNTTIKPLLSPQKVIIRQSTLKPAVVPGTGQVIRLPTSQNIIQNTANVGQFQLQGGKQVQYVRLVSTPSSTGNSITTLTNTSNASVTIVPKSVAKTATLTTIRTQQPAMKMVPIAPATPNLRAVVPKTFTSQPGQRILIPASATQIRPACSVALPTSGSAVLPSAASSYVVLPPECIQPVTSTPITNQKAELQAAGTAQINLSALSQSSNASQSSVETSPSVSESSGSQKASSKAQMEPNGIRPRKPCNCTKSQCLKLYCDCFANGEFCHQCNCNNCFNNLEHEEERQRAIKSCLERNPTAFRPKIGKGMIGDERRHNRGCNCKRSGCLKNYCECYEAKISCSPNCKCIGCRNVEDISSRPFNDFGDEMDGKIRESSDLKQKFTAFQDLALRHFNLSCGSKHPYGFMTNEVLTATCQCLLYQAEECERLSCSIKETEQIIIEEFGKCLVQIIEYANKSECMKSEANSLPP